MEEIKNRKWSADTVETPWPQQCSDVAVEGLSEQLHPLLSLRSIEFRWDRELTTEREDLRTLLTVSKLLETCGNNIAMKFITIVENLSMIN